jgi:hypothetical protein
MILYQLYNQENNYLFGRIIELSFVKNISSFVTTDSR